MKATTKVKWLSVAIVICLIVMGFLGYFTWNLNQKVEGLQARTSADVQIPIAQLPDPWPKNWDPWSDNWDSSGQFSDLQKQMDDLMNRMLPGHSIFSNQGFGLSQSSPKISMDETGEEYIVVVTVPEGEEVELNTELSENTLKIFGKVKNTSENNNGDFFGRSMSTSQFSQSMTLSEPVDESGMTIDQEDTKIVITIPKRGN